MSSSGRRNPFGQRFTVVGAVVAASACVFGTTAFTVAPEASAAPATTCGVLAGGASPVAQAAVGYACDEVAKAVPYVWGGGHGAVPGPSGGGLDCSGLVRYAYAEATGADPIGSGSTITEWDTLGGTRFSGAQGTGPLLPGDLLYWSSNGAASGIHHVAIYLGANEIAQEPETGETAQVVPFFSSGYYGAIRPFPGGSLSMGTGNSVNGGIDDVSGDGHADLLWSDGSAVNYLPDSSSTNPGGVPFSGNSAPVVTGLPAGALVAAGAITGHNTADLFIYDPSTDEVRLYPGVGGSTPYSGTGYVVASYLGSNVTKIFASDVSGDGYADLVYTKSDGTAWYLPNNMGSTSDHLPFAGESAVQIVSGLPSDAVVAMGDLNGDHHADMLYTDGGNLYALLNTGSASAPFT
ncbi:MAG TPA: NlpC/P60 family protein, partial [Pseudonocardiaceae bacterium]|nr:NlpC/P60 family protein [Pseudonocardiaceae bacterium]